MDDRNHLAQSAGEPVSKSQRKRDSLELQSLGVELVKLSHEQLIGMALPVDLFDAILQAKSIRQHGALKRQLKFVGGILRGVDTGPIREQMACLQMQSSRAVREHHKIEQWRDKLIEEGDGALGDLMSKIPQLDRQKVRQLVRNARLERDRQNSRKSSKALYRYLRERLE